MLCYVLFNVNYFTITIGGLCYGLRDTVFVELNGGVATWLSQVVTYDLT